jgi:PAS domain S-box-containing protein
MPSHQAAQAPLSFPTVAPETAITSLLAGHFVPVVAIVALSILALAGWLLGLPQLAGGFGKLPLMTPSAATTFLAAAISLVCWQKHWRTAAVAAAAFVLLAGGVALTEFFLGTDVPSGLSPGRPMGPRSALGFLLCGGALLLLEGGERRVRCSQILVGGAFVVVAVSVLGHLLGVPALYSVSPEQGLSVTTALAFSALMLGIGVRHVDRGYMAQILGSGAGGLLLREFLVVVLVLPPLFALLLAAGEHAGLSYTPRTILLIAGVMFVLLIAVLLRAARLLDRYEQRLVDANAHLEQQVAARTTRLTDSEEHLRRVLDNLSAFAGVLAPDGTVLQANRAPLQASGLTDADVLGRKVWECYWWNHSAELQEQVREVVRRAAQGETFRFDVKVRMPGDSRMWIDFQLVPLRDASGRITHLVPSAMDITARKAAEKALKGSERRYRTLFENIDEGFCIIQLVFDESEKAVDFRFLEVNRAFEQHTGLQNAAGRTARELAPAIEPFWFDRYGRVAITGEPLRFTDQSTAMGRWFDLYATRIGEPHERMVGVLLKDITAHKTAEEALREADRRKDEFLAILAHELRNPLAPIRNGVEILRLAENPGQRSVQSVLPMMERQVQHMGRLLDELLDISRITLGKIELRRQPLDVAHAIDAAIETSRPFIAERNHALETVLPTEPVLVDADPVRLSQVFANLINNAAKYMDAGGRIFVKAEQQGKHVVVSVKDDGAGIAPADLTSIFEMFSRGGGSPSDSQSGLGVGLALAKRLVALHGGSIEACSDGLGRGSEFRVRLPVLNEQIAPNPAQPVKAGPKALRILVVDDNPDAASVLSVLLEIMGNQVRTAHGGEEAIRLATEFAPHAVLLDLGMPKMDGYEVCRHLRRLPSGSEMAVIAITGWGQDEDRRRTRESGFDDHLVKPVDSNDLTRVLAELPVAGRPH